MLHEVLLSLSGFPSPLFDPGSTTGEVAADFPLLSPPEAALLSSVGKLALRHREVRDHVSRIATSHPSTVCRAVAHSIQATQLARFRRKILDVEERILKNDVGTVAAYNIVPLTGLVGEFDGWRRRMDWFWTISVYMQTPADKTDQAPPSTCSGATLIDKLRREAQTGYSDIEEVALELGQVAETAWLRHLASWVLHGRLPTAGAADFFIHAVETEGQQSFEVQTQLLPSFVTTYTATSILFIGHSLNQIKARDRVADRVISSQTLPEAELVPRHLQYLSEIRSPVTSAGLSSVIASIRDSLSQNILQRLLPLPKVMQTMTLLYEFFLLGRREFAGILIKQADARLEARGTSQPSSRANASGDAQDNVRGLLYRDSELSAILEACFSNLATISGPNDDPDDPSDSVLEQARATVKLKTDRSRQSSKASTVFNDLLLPMPTYLTLALSWPLDLFLSAADIGVYSRVNTYLLSIERAHIHLTDLWRLTPMRRDHPCPPGPPASSTERGRQSLIARKARRRVRDIKMRKVWATVGKAAFFLSELTLYFNGAVVHDAWIELRAQMEGRDRGRPSSASDNSTTATTQLAFRNSSHRETTDEAAPRPTGSQASSRPATATTDTSSQDPSALAALHQAYLRSLQDALLLEDRDFTKELRALMQHLDNLSAQVRRLQGAYAGLDLEEDDGVVDGLTDWRAEERAAELELDRARKKADEGLRACVDALGRLDAAAVQRPGVLPLESENEAGVVSGGGAGPGGAAGWKWKAPGVDRLLMKLEFGREDNLPASGDEDGM